MGVFDDLVPQSGMQPGQQLAQPRPDKGVFDWVADTFGPNGNLRGSAIGGMMQGMADPVVGAVQTVANLPGIKNIFGDLVNNAVKDKGAEYESARASAGRGGFDAARMAGNVASPVNLAIAAKVPLAATGSARVGQGAMLGGAAGAMEPVTNTKDFWSDKAQQVGTGAMAGAIATPILGKIGDSLARKFAPGAGVANPAEVDNVISTALAETGQSIADVSPAKLQSLRDQVQQSLSAGQRLDAAALLRKSDFESVGINPLQGQITRDPMQWAREMNLRGVAGVGDPIAERLNSQAIAIKNGVGEFSKDASEAFSAGDQLRNSLKATDEAMRSRVSGLYQAARNDAGKDLDVPLQGLAQDYADVLSRFGDKVPSGVRSQLDALGLNKGVQQKVFTIEEADKILKVINDHVGGDMATNRALTELRSSVKNAVLAADPSGGPFKPAVDAAAQRFRLHEAIPALESASQGSTAADDFVKRFVINGKANDVKGMGKLLQLVDPDAYKQARAQIGEDLRRAGFGENTAGDKGFAQNSFNKRLRELGTEKLSAFFTPEEIDKLKTMGRVGAYITSEPAGSAPNRSNTASAAMNLLGQIPGGGMVRTVASGVNALTQSVKNASTAKNALAAAVPSSRAELSAEQANMLAFILSGGAVASGAAASGSVRK